MLITDASSPSARSAALWAALDAARPRVFALRIPTGTRDRAALAVLRANLAACRVGETEGRVIAGDATRPPRAESACGLIFLDPPYGAGLPGMVLPALRGAGWVAPGALCCLETGRAEDMPDLPGWEPLAEREHGAARVLVWRDTGA